jgi:hypothetical protein
MTLGFLLIISNNNLEMHNKENIDKFFNISASWIDKIYFNTQYLTSQAIKLSWLPQ